MATHIIPANQWIDLYSVSGIETGRQIEIQNTGTNDLFLSDQSTQPPVDSKEYRVATPRSFMTNDNGDQGAWAFSRQQQGQLNIRLVI